MTTPHSFPGTRRPFAVGFAVGSLMTLPVTLLALAVPAFEPLAPFLVPGAALLQPLSPVMASWPGAVNLLLGSLANGLVVGALAAGGALVVRRR